MASDQKSCKAFLIRLGVALLVELGVFIGIYTSYQNSKDFIESECTVTMYETLYTTECNCNDQEHCMNGYSPCLKIYVYLFDKDSNNRTALLYFSDISYHHDKECSYPSCETKEKAEDTFRVTFAQDFLQFKNTYSEVGKTLHCYYNPEKDEAVITKTTKFEYLYLVLLIFVVYVVLEAKYQFSSDE